MLRVLENRVLRRISGPKRDEVEDSTKDYIMREFILFLIKKQSCDQIKKNWVGGTCGLYRRAVS